MTYVKVNKSNQKTIKRLITNRKNQKELAVTIICVLAFVLLVAFIGIMLLL